jgi:hypothetical protein
MIFKQEKTGVILLCPTQVKSARAIQFGCGYGSPKQPWDRSKFIELHVGASVLVISGVLVP